MPNPTDPAQRSETRTRRSRHRFLVSLQGENFEAARASLPGHVVIGSHSPAHCNIRLFPLRSPDGFEGYHGYGKTPMEALRDAAWNWLDAIKGVTEPPTRHPLGGTERE